MASITMMPPEIINKILESPHVNFKEIVMLSATCTQLNQVIRDSNIWRKKFFQRWPALTNVYSKFASKDINFKEHAAISVTCRQKLLYHLSKMLELHHYKEDLTHLDMSVYDSLFCQRQNAHSMGYYFLVDELTTQLQRSVQICDFTDRYYIEKILVHVKHTYIREEWEHFINLPPQKQTLEHAVTFASQWCQPLENITYSQISTMLDTISQRAMDCLKEKYPKHPIFSINLERLAYWRNNNINENQFEDENSKKILSVISHILFEHLNYHGANERCYEMDNVLIDQVLLIREGIPLSLAIVYESIARRLGVFCEITSFPTHCFLCWKAKHYTADAITEERFYIDVLNNGKFLSKSDCPKIGSALKCPLEGNENMSCRISASQVMLRVSHHLEASVQRQNIIYNKPTIVRMLLEFRQMVDSNNIETITQLCHYYTSHKMDVADLINMLENIIMILGNLNLPTSYIRSVINDYKQFPPYDLNIETVPKFRTPYLKFAVGIIISYTDPDEQPCTGVVIGWDLQPSKITVNSWLNNLILREGLFQPCYKILCEGKYIEYVAEEMLTLAIPRLLEHEEIGRYFCKYDETHYVANKMLNRLYPEDVAACKTCIAMHQSSIPRYV